MREVKIMSKIFLQLIQYQNDQKQYNDGQRENIKNHLKKYIFLSGMLMFGFCAVTGGMLKRMGMN